MRLKLTADATGALTIHHPLTVLEGAYAVSLYPGDDGLLCRVEVSKPIDPDSEPLPSFRMTPGGRTQAIIHVPASEAQQDLESVLQHLESIGFFWMRVYRIGWGDAKVEWIPDNEEERRRLSLYSQSGERSFPDTPKPLNPQMVREIVRFRDRDQRMVIPLAFMREGDAAYRSFRFVPACMQFFFYLEDLYGGGQWKTRRLKERFLASQHLQEAAARIRAELLEPSSTDHRRTIEAFLAEEHLPFNEGGLIELLIKIRGRLHHFSQRDPGRRGHPLNNEEFRHVAYLELQFCYQSYVSIVRDGEPR